MITNQKLNTLQLFLVLLMLLFGLSVHTQSGEIIKIEQNGIMANNIEINITLPYDEPKPIEIYKKTMEIKGYVIRSGSIIEVPKNTTLGLISANGNELEIVAKEQSKRVEYFVSSSREIYKSLDKHDSGNLLVRVLKPLVGDVKTANIKGTMNGAAKGTQWEVWNNGEDLFFKHLEGKVAINGRLKFEMEDDIIKLDGEIKRILYITESVYTLSEKDSSFTFNKDDLLKPQLITEESINKFFKVELKKQNRILKSSGPHAKKGFKYLGNGQYQDGITEYTKAIELGEIDTDRFIQASLILTEAYHEMDAKKNIANSGFQSSKIKKNLDTWLDASLYFIKETDSVSNAKYEHFKKKGLNNIANAFGYDVVLSKEYLAWAYIVKLKLNGCLENKDQNPLNLMREARKIEKSL